MGGGGHGSKQAAKEAHAAMDAVKEAGGDIKKEAAKAKKRFWTTEQEVEYCVEKWGEGSLHIRGVEYWTSHHMQMILVGLLILDVVIVFVELFVDAEFPQCSLCQRDTVSCCLASAASGSGSGSSSGRSLFEDPLATASDFGLSASEWHSLLDSARPQREPLGFDFHRMLQSSGSSGSSSGSGSGHTLCSSGLVELTSYGGASVTTGCDTHQYPVVHSLHTVLFALSMLILAIFEIELVTLLICLDWHFFLNPFYAVDLIVVTLSLVLEGYTYWAQSYNSSIDISQLIIIMRIWRMARVGHGISSAGRELQEKQILLLESHIHKLEAELHKLAPPEELGDIDEMSAVIEHDLRELEKEVGGRKVDEHHMDRQIKSAGVKSATPQGSAKV